MNDLKKLMVCLDLSEMDSLLIQYSAFLINQLGFTDVHFVHVTKEFDIPDELMGEFPDLDQPLDEIIQSELNELVEDIFDVNTQYPVASSGKFHTKGDSEKEESKPTYSVSIHVESGNILEQLISKAREIDPDLTLVGKKTSYKGTGLVLGSIANFMPSSILFVPEQVSFRLDRFLVPVDFSEASELALKRILNITNSMEAETEACHVFELPSQFFPSTIPIEKLELSARKSLKVKVDSFIKKLEPLNRPIPFEFILGEGRDLADVLYHEAIQKHADMLVLGSKNRSVKTALYKGTVVEKLANPYYPIPVYIVKDKKQSKRLWEGLFTK